MLVEFTGIPGAGKSSVRSALLDRLAGTGIEVVLPTHLRYGSKLPTGWQHRRLLLWAARVLAASSRSTTDKVSAWRFLMVSLDRHRKASDLPAQQMCVLDEGLAQRAFLLMVDGDRVRDELVGRYFDLVPLSDVVVQVEVTPQVALSRLRARAERGIPPRLADLDEPELLDRLAGGAEVLDRARGLTPDPTSTVIDVDGTRPLDETAGELVDRLLELRPGR